ncbi:MAG: hypothetical protein ACOC10_09685, partial [Bacteroidota bacterium]
FFPILRALVLRHTIKHNGWWYETCRIAGLRHYPLLQKLEVGRNARIPSETGMFYTACVRPA